MYAHSETRILMRGSDEIVVVVAVDTESGHDERSSHPQRFVYPDPVYSECVQDPCIKILYCCMLLVPCLVLPRPAVRP